MIRGFYAAASGMIAQMARQEGYAQNLANANTVGYRRTRAAVGGFREDLTAALGAASAAGGGVAARDAGMDLATGPLTSTDRPLDLALSGSAFFTVQTPRGLAYTRDGRFRLDNQRRLVTGAGHPVLGERGPIVLPNTQFTVTDRGDIVCQGQPVDALRLREPAGPRPVGGGLYLASQSRPATASTVNQGMVEQANVNAIEEMGRMLNGFRLYEANATALRYQDESLSTLYQVLA